MLTGLLERLMRTPERAQHGHWQGAGFSARILIPNYRERIERHYADLLSGGLEALCTRQEIPFHFRHFGLVLDFDAETGLVLYDDDRILRDDLRKAVAAFGPVILRNASLGPSLREDCQHNIFPDLRFHYDRAANQPNQMSMYTRDCSDPVQREPRKSSTVFIANIIAYLQQQRQEPGRPDSGRKGVKASYELFKNEPLAPLVGDIVLEQEWTAPTKAGEICVIDNRTVLHASYYRNGRTPGYPIGTRYLA